MLIIFIPAGPLIFVALLYEAMGIVLAWLIRQFFWVPHRFRYGLLVAGGWGNVGDIRTSSRHKLLFQNVDSAHLSLQRMLS